MLAEEEFAREVAQRHGLPDGSVVALTGRGSVNHIFVLEGPEAGCVVRFPIDRLRHDEFEVEQWCLEQAARYGIPSPQVLARGFMSGTPYLVQSFVEGTPGSAECFDPHAWEALGRYGRIVHGIDWKDGPEGLFSRFGRDPIQAWRLHVQYNLDQLVATDRLIEIGVYRPSQQADLRSIAAGLLGTEISHGLRHGDLSPRNLLIRPGADPVLLDWGQATVGPVPYGDILGPLRSHLLVTGRPAEAEINAFAAALGTPLSEIQDLLHSLLVLEALDRVRWAIDERPDRLDELAVAARDTLDALSLL